MVAVLGGWVVEGEGVLSGVGPGDADGDGGALLEGICGVQLGQGAVPVAAGWEVVGCLLYTSDAADD